MQTIVVPTDFSPNAYNAARYAIALAGDIKASKIILYNAYMPYVPEDAELGLPLQVNMEEFKKMSETALVKMKNQLQQDLSPMAEIVYESDYNIIDNGILETCKKHNAELIIMSVTVSDSKLEEALLGSSAVDVARHSETPVIIVPHNVTYTKLKKVLLALDLKKVASTTPTYEIKKLLDATHAKLDVLHVEAHATETKTGFKSELELFNSLFSNYNLQFHFVKGETVADTINTFALENKSDLIIVIPKKHGLFDSLFKRSQTKALAFHSHIPVMSIHE